jgi:hypothetical protein
MAYLIAKDNGIFGKPDRKVRISWRDIQVKQFLKYFVCVCLCVIKSNIFPSSSKNDTDQFREETPQSVPSNSSQDKSMATVTQHICTPTAACTNDDSLLNDTINCFLLVDGLNDL